MPVSASSLRRELLVGEGEHAAVGVVDEDDLLGAEQALGDGQRADRVVGDDAAGVADHVGVALARGRARRRVEPRVHAGHHGDLLAPAGAAGRPCRRSRRRPRRCAGVRRWRSCRRTATGHGRLARVETIPGAIAGSSPFPPIADYAFLSDCETTALIAPSGNVEWMCVPRMDSPSVFGAILDRDAGGFRLGPADVMVPAGRRYLPGTMVARDQLGDAHGWVIVRDVLCIGPWHHEDERSDSHRRSPTDYEAEHVLAAHGQVRPGIGRGPPRLRAGLRLRRPGGRVAVLRGRLPRGGRQVRGHGDRAAAGHRHAPRLRGARARRRARSSARATSPLPRWAGPSTRCPATYEEASERLERTAHYWQEWLKHGSFPDHPWRTYLQRSALTLKGLTYAPDRRDDRRRRRRRCPRPPAASATGTTATAGSATRRSCSGPCTRSASTGRRTTSSTSSPTWPRRRSASSRSCTASAGRASSPSRRSTTCRATTGRVPCAWATGPTTRTSTTSGARSSTRSTSTPRRAISCPSGSGRSSSARSTWRWRSGASPTAASGRCAASPSTSPPRSSCAGSPSTAARASRRSARTTRRPRAGRRRRTRSTPTSARTASTRVASSPSTTRPTRSTHPSC